MLSDEEKKAIEYLKRHIIPVYGKKGQIEYFLNDIVLNLIEKQSKEIEEYKKQLDLDYVDKHFVPVERYNQLEKEIEELNKSDESKEQSSMKYYNLYRELVDKIKAKIEEYEKEIQIRKNVINNDVLDKQTIEKARIEWACMEDFIYEMQSLLEKED